MKRNTTAIAILAASFAFAPGTALAAGPPETVHVTYHVQAGRLDEFLAVLRQHFPACRKDGLVLAEPHIILSSTESGGKPVVIEILTWKDSDAPDSVAEHHPDIKKIWDGLNALVEKRNGTAGIEIDEMDIVTDAAGPVR